MMMIVEILAAFVIARFGGVLTYRDFYDAERITGWFLVALGVALAVLAGRHL